MKRSTLIIFTLILSLILMVPVINASDDMARKLNDVLMQAPANKFWQIMAEELNAMITAKQTDFLIVDVRPNPAEYGQGHIPGAIRIPVQEVLSPENIKKLPKDKKVILVCVTGQTQNLPIIALRALGYNAYTMSFGMSAWAKGYYGAGIMQNAINKANYPLAR